MNVRKFDWVLLALAIFFASKPVLMFGSGLLRKLRWIEFEIRLGNSRLFPELLVLSVNVNVIDDEIGGIVPWHIETLLGVAWELLFPAIPFKHFGVGFVHFFLRGYSV